MSHEDKYHGVKILKGWERLSAGKRFYLYAVKRASEESTRIVYGNIECCISAEKNSRSNKIISDIHSEVENTITDDGLSFLHSILKNFPILSEKNQKCIYYLSAYS